MKQYFCISRSWRGICQFFIAIAVCFFMITEMAIPTYASGTGWIEAKVTAPEGLSNYLILSLVHDDTQEEYDFPILPDNGFQLFEKVPVGSYTVAGVWVFQDYRYRVTANVNAFVVEEDTIIPIELTVNVSDEVESSDVPETETDEATESWLVSKMEDLTDQALSSENSKEDNFDEVSEGEELKETEAVTDDSDNEGSEVNDDTEKEAKEEKTEKGFWQDMLIRVIGTLIFGGIFFGIYFISRRKYR